MQIAVYMHLLNFFSQEESIFHQIFKGVYDPQNFALKIDDNPGSSFTTVDIA